MGRFAFNRERNLTFGGRRVDRVRSPNPAFYREQRWPGDNFLCEWGKKWNLLNEKNIDRSKKLFLKGCCNNEEFSFKCEWIMKEIQTKFWLVFWWIIIVTLILVEQLQRDVYPILLKPKSIYIANTSETLKTINVISTIACWEANCRTIRGVHNFLMRLYILEFGCILVDTGNNEPNISKGATSLKTNMAMENHHS